MSDRCTAVLASAESVAAVSTAVSRVSSKALDQRARSWGEFNWRGSLSTNRLRIEYGLNTDGVRIEYRLNTDGRPTTIGWNAVLGWDTARLQETSMQSFAWHGNDLLPGDEVRQGDEECCQDK